MEEQFIYLNRRILICTHALTNKIIAEMRATGRPKARGCRILTFRQAGKTP
jgi:hypothetical protein